MILICTQTDKNGFAPEYGPLFEALEGIAKALQKKPAGNVPVVVFESTLAPSSMLDRRAPAVREVLGCTMDATSSSATRPIA